MNGHQVFCGLGVTLLLIATWIERGTAAAFTIIIVTTCGYTLGGGFKP